MGQCFLFPCLGPLTSSHPCNTIVTDTRNDRVNKAEQRHTPHATCVDHSDWRIAVYTGILSFSRFPYSGCCCNTELQQQHSMRACGNYPCCSPPPPPAPLPLFGAPTHMQSVTHARSQGQASSCPPNGQQQLGCCNCCSSSSALAHSPPTIITAEQQQCQST
jgi:hypothetical protein